MAGSSASRRLAEQAVERGAAQKIGELAGLLGFLSRRKVRNVLEIGSLDGGTVWCFGQIAQSVVSIDIEPVRNAPRWFVWGDSHLESTKARLPPLRYDVIFIDGDHTYEGVKQDWEMYSPLVSARGVVVLHDIVDHPPETGCEVARFWRELKVGRKTREFITPVAQQAMRGVLPVASCGIGVVL